MLRSPAPLAAALLWLAACSSKGEQAAPKTTPETSSETSTLLVFTRTTGFRHDSIPAGIACLTELAEALGHEVVATEDPAEFTAQLATCDAVAFLSTTGDVLDDAQQAAFESWYRAGGAWLGIHAAADTEYDWPWYGRLVGARFASHPQIQMALLWRTDAEHPSTAFLPEAWTRTDEWYDYKEVQPGLTTLLRLDEASYSDHANMMADGGEHPIAWCQEFDGGRAWYTGGGHTKASFDEPLFRLHLATGLEWCLAGAAD